MPCCLFAASIISVTFLSSSFLFLFSALTFLRMVLSSSEKIVILFNKQAFEARNFSGFEKDILATKLHQLSGWIRWLERPLSSKQASLKLLCELREWKGGTVWKNLRNGDATRVCSRL